MTGSDVVEFLDDDDAEAEPDEELAAAPPPRRRGVLVGGLVAVALVAAALVTRGLVSGGDDKPRASAPTVRVSSIAPRPLPRVIRPTITTPLPAGIADCPEAGDGASCAVTTDVSAAVMVAIEREFPGAGPVTGITARVRDTGFGPGGIWYREVHANEGRLTLFVRVERRRIADADALSTTENITGVTIQQVYLFPSFSVTVRVGVPSSTAATKGLYARIQALSHDERLGQV